MKVVWILLASLLVLCIFHESDAWRRRFRLRRIVPRIRARRIIPRIRVRRIVRLPRIRRIVRLPSVRFRRIVRLPSVRFRRIIRLPSLGSVVGLPILDKVIKLPKIKFRLRRIFRRRRPNPQPQPQPTTPAPGIGTVEPTVPPCPEICAGVCPEKCATWNCPCHWVCPTTCDLFTKDEPDPSRGGSMVRETQAPFVWPYDGFPAPLPCDFVTYDDNKDGQISPAELAYTVRQRARDSQNMMVFNKMDMDRDGFLTPDEFDSMLLLKNCEEITAG